MIYSNTSVVPYYTCTLALLDRAARAFDSEVRRCFAALLSPRALPSCVLRDAVAQAMLPVKEGGMALEQIHRRRHAAYVAAWADCARFAPVAGLSHTQCTEHKGDVGITHLPLRR